MKETKQKEGDDEKKQGDEASKTDTPKPAATEENKPEGENPAKVAQPEEVKKPPVSVEEVAANPTKAGVSDLIGGKDLSKPIEEGGESPRQNKPKDSSELV